MTWQAKGADVAEQDDLQASFAPLLAQLTRQWRRAVDRRLQPYGLSEATWRPLLHLSRAGETMNQRELAAALGVDSSAVVRLLDQLQASGLIERREDEADRRAKTLHITPAGQDIAAQVESVSRAVRAQALAGIAPQELAATHAVLSRISASLAELSQEEAA